MAEVEFAGVKFKGGKMIAIIMALSTLGGGLYAGFEFYKDYMNMRTKIEKYVAPNLSGFDKKLAVLKKEMEGIVNKAELKLEVTETKVKVIVSEFNKKLAVLKKEMEGVVNKAETRVEVGEARVEVIVSEFESLKNEIKAFEKLEEGIKQTAEDARDYTKEIKRDLKDELHTMSVQLDSVEKRGKEAFNQVRNSIETNDGKVRTMVTVNSDRFDARREQLRNDMDNLEKRIKSEMKELKETINKKIMKALENPLANMRK